MLRWHVGLQRQRSHGGAGRQPAVSGSRSLPAARGRWALVPTVVRRKRHPLCDRVTNYAKLYPPLAAICNKINLPNYARLDKYGTPPTRDSNEWVRGTGVRLWISYQWEQREQKKGQKPEGKEVKGFDAHSRAPLFTSQRSNGSRQTGGPETGGQGGERV